MKTFTSICILTGFFSLVHGQEVQRKPYYSREIGMSVDNDIIFFVDFYYTAGQDIWYRRLANPHSRIYHCFRGSKTDSSKVIIQYHAGYKIFTPRNIDFSDTKTMDRPYAGWDFASMGITNFPSLRQANRYEAEVGVVGKISGMGQLQQWVHQHTDFQPPEGWSSQIRDEVVLNLYYSRFQAFEAARNIDFVSLSAVQAGTGGNKLSQDLTCRLFQFNSIDNSVFTQSRVNWDTRAQSKRKKQEIFVFLGYGVDYVLSNIFIEGSLFRGNRSVFTVPVQPWVFRRDLGIMFSSHGCSLTATFYHLTKEVRHGTDHDYGSLALAVRF